MSEQTFNACLSSRRCSMPCRSSKKAPRTSRRKIHADPFVNGKKVWPAVSIRGLDKMTIRG